MGLNYHHLNHHPMNLKNLSLMLSATLALTTFANPVHGQQGSASLGKNELGINLLSYAGRPSGSIAFSQSFYAHPFSGISYRRHIGQSAIRLALARHELSQPQSVFGTWISEGDYEATLIKLGWERSFSTKSFSPYAATDLIGIKSVAVGNEGGGIVANAREFVTDRLGVGLSPTLGIRYRPLRWLSFFAETSLDIIYSRQRSHYTQVLPETVNPRYSEVDTGFATQFNPLSALVINVVF